MKHLILLLTVSMTMACSNKGSDSTDPGSPDAVTYGTVTLSTPSSGCMVTYDVTMDGQPLTTLSADDSYIFTTETGSHSFSASITRFCPGVAPINGGISRVTLQVTEFGAAGSF